MKVIVKNIWLVNSPMNRIYNYCNIHFGSTPSVHHIQGCKFSCFCRNSCFHEVQIPALLFSAHFGGFEPRFTHFFRLFPSPLTFSQNVSLFIIQKIDFRQNMAIWMQPRHTHNLTQAQDLWPYAQCYLIANCVCQESIVCLHGSQAQFCYAKVCSILSEIYFFSM